MAEEQSIPGEKPKKVNENVSIPPPSELLVSNEQKAPENMEVHHHPDLLHHKKHYKEYLLEFLMIFLAVTLGFFAENIREHISDNEKEEQYIRSFIQNLQDDTSKLKNAIDENNKKLSTLDKLMSLSLTNLSAQGNRLLFYRYCINAIGFYSIFRSNDATMMQLMNSGGLRLIRNDYVADSIAKYSNEIKIIYASENSYSNATNAAINATHEVLDFSIFYDTAYFKNGDFKNKLIPLSSDNPKQMKLLINEVAFEIGATKNYIYNMQLRLPFAIRLIRFLKKEYDIE